MASHINPDPRRAAYRQLRQYERDLRLELAVSQLASFVHLLFSAFKLGWFSRSMILTWVALRHHLQAKRAQRRTAA